MESSISQKIQLLVSFGAIGVVIFLALIIYIIYIYQSKIFNGKLQLEKQESEHRMQMLISMNEAQEKERARIAHDIHDEVGAIFFMAKMSAGEMANKSKDEICKKHAAETESLIIQGINELRKSIQALTPTLLEKLGFIQSIEKFTHLIQNNIHVEFKMEGEYVKLSKNAELAIYRVIQELVNNALKHSQAKKIEIDIIQKPELLTIIVADDGVGFDLKNNSESMGLGLKNIESRIFLIGGETKFVSFPNQGTICRIEIPVFKNI